MSRVEGADRYGTSVALSQVSFQPGVPVAYRLPHLVSAVDVATGSNYPAALSGAAAADRGPGRIRGGQ